ncbi:hypothetical protein PAEPH01_1215, partial [Pancytospora epiphaga]
MIFKRWRLIYVAASVKMLVATWNASGPHNENNLEANDVEHYAQYNFAASEYQGLQSYGNEMGSHDTYNESMTWGFYNTEILTGSRLEERIGQEKVENPSVEQLVAEFKQIEQNMSSGVQLSVDEYGKRIEEVIKEQETIELGTLVNELEEMPIQKLIKKYESYNMPEQSHSLAISQSAEGSPYDYTNSTFLNKLLHSPSLFITADSIRMRFSGQFLSFLSSDQIIRVLIVLLENKLELAKEDQKEFIEMIFGHIDYSLELVITKDQVVVLVEAMMRSNVPDYFEQVFLTWKMWYSFTENDQETMLKDTKKEHKREILVMLYLFVMNKDEDNSQQCEIFKNNIKDQYKETGILKEGYLAKDVVIERNGWVFTLLCIILDTFDTCLLDIPEVFKGLDRDTVISFCNFFREQFFSCDKNPKVQFLRYKSHVCYAFTKFTPEFEQTNNLGKSKNIKTNSRLYFNPENVKFEFANWIKILKNNNNVNNAISADEHEKEIVNAFAMFRQIMQSNEYNFNMFLKMYNKIGFTKAPNRPYFILLFSLTNRNILRDLSKHIQTTPNFIRRYQFIEDIFIKTASSNLKLHLKHSATVCVIKIHEALLKLNAKGSITMHREHYFYQRFLFHP